MNAPGSPGIAPAWSSSAKDAVGTALGASRLWFTIGRGILNEVYWPRVDSPQIRDLGFIVADDQGFWSEVKRDATYDLRSPAPGIPAYTVVHEHARYTLTLDYCPDPDRDVLLIRARLDASEPLRLSALLAPHLGNSGYDNTAWLSEERGQLALLAQRATDCLALCAWSAAEAPAFARASAGFVGVSDGWQDFALHGRMTWTYQRAEGGNVALLGELGTSETTLALGFGDTPDLAQTLALASLQFPFAQVWDEYVAAWSDWQGQCHFPELPDDLRAIGRISAAVLKIHEDRVVPGALVASLSVPWGQSHDDLGGYHLVWVRDLVEAAGGLLAVGAVEDTRRILAYLIATQQPDGHWVQNQWLDGRPYWHGAQLDEVGFPILLAQALRERDALDGLDVRQMVERAASYLAQNGPITGQDRWEEDSGLSPFTLAVVISALICGAEWLDGDAQTYALELADTWNNRLEEWLYVEGTDLANRLGVSGYYVRISPDDVGPLPGAIGRLVPLKNRPASSATDLAENVISLEFLELVRLGLRRADDPRIRDSLRVADALLRVETPNGPAWHRYTGDGYGEHEDGSPFDGNGVGRAWPLLTGERGLIALLAGESATPYLTAMAQMASRGGMLPEQVWDAPNLPEEHLERGRPTGSAMPLVWAHAEYLKLAASVALGYAVDRPQPVWDRYQGSAPDVPWTTWRFAHQSTTLPAGRLLRIEVLAPARIRWTADGWATARDSPTRDTRLGVHIADLPVAAAAPGTVVTFTYFWPVANRWEGNDFTIQVS